MPAVTARFPVHTSNDPAKTVIPQGQGAMYLDMLLSEYYGKMVRQGNSFKIQGIQASLTPDASSLGIDVGMSAEVQIHYVPTTRHSKYAWNQVYKGWRNQKKLATAVGGQVRYDDLEFGWNDEEGHDRQRTSTIFGSGMSDSLQEKLALTGASTASAGVNVGTYSLQDYYNSSYETPEPSRDPFTNTDIKEPKWGSTPFPEIQALHCTATSSAQWFEIPGANIHQGAITMGDIQELPVPCESLCGVLFVEAYIMPDDTAGQFEDDFWLDVTIWVSSWKPIVTHRARKSRNSSRYSRGGKRSGRGRYTKRYRRKRR